MRAVPTQKNKDKAAKTVKYEAIPDETIPLKKVCASNHLTQFITRSPNVALIRISISNPGKDEKTSPIRMIKLSIHPPLYPASNPNTLPIIRDPLTTTAVVTIKVVRAQ